MNRFPTWVILAAAGLFLGLTLLVVVPVLGTALRGVPSTDAGGVERGVVAARVDDAVLYREDMALLNLDDEDARNWYRDELLARSAIDEGLENPAMSGLLQRRARQVYLRDTLLEHIASSLDDPTDQEALAFMRQHPEDYLLERHCFHILLADSATADSVHGVLSRGAAFQLTAQRLSLSQKAVVGGDLGFVTGGELMLSGLPAEAAALEGLGPVFHTADGWHILMVTETRALEDTTRVMAAVRGHLYNQRFLAAVDSVAAAASRRYDCEVIP